MDHGFALRSEMDVADAVLSLLILLAGGVTGYLAVKVLKKRPKQADLEAQHRDALNKKGSCLLRVVAPAGIFRYEVVPWEGEGYLPRESDLAPEGRFLVRQDSHGWHWAYLDTVSGPSYWTHENGSLSRKEYASFDVIWRYSSAPAPSKEAAEKVMKQLWDAALMDLNSKWEAVSHPLEGDI